MAEYTLRMQGPVFPAAVDVHGWSSLVLRRQLNAPGEARLVLPRSAVDESLLARDARLTVVRDGRLPLGGVWLLRWVERVTLDAVPAYRLHFVDQISLLDNPIIAYPAGTSYTAKSGPADNLIKQFARENMGALATDAARDRSAYVAIADDTGQGATTYKVATKRRLLGVCQDVARASTQRGTPLFFDLVPVRDGMLELRTAVGAWGVDHRGGTRAPVVLSGALGTLADAERSDDYRFDFSVVYAAGQGVGSQRVVVTTQDAARLAASPWARRERFVDARNLKTLASLDSTAAATLLHGRPRLQMRGVVHDRPGCVFGVQWGYGDLVDAAVDGVVVGCRVEQVTLDVTPAAEQITVDLLDARAESSAGLSVAQQLEELGSADAATIGTVPEPWGVPQAGADGTLDAGWLPSTIARASQLPAHSVTPAPATSPVSDGAGVIADGWLSGSIAKLGVGGAPGRVAFYGSGNALAGTSKLMWDTAHNYLGVNTTTPVAQLHIVDEAGSVTRGIVIAEHINALAGASLGFLRSRGTEAAPLALQNGDYVGGFATQTYDGSQYIAEAALVTMILDGTVSSGTTPVSIGFNTRAAGAAWALPPRLRVRSDGGIELPELSPAPGNPAADKMVLYVRDNGSGKTQIVAKWSSGTITVIATQP